MRGVLLFLFCVGTVGCEGETCKSATPWYEDRDGDGFGTEAERIVACDAPDGYVDNTDDCDDRDATLFPGAAEVCGDGQVNDCAGTVETAGASCTVAAVASAASAASLTVTGGAAGDALGSSVAGVGDADGDSVPDVLIGAPAAGGAGRAYLFWGTESGEIAPESANATFVGESEGDALGASVAAAGDLNADLEGDLLLGAPQAGSAAGAVWVVSHEVNGEIALSDADATLTGAEAGDLAGSTLLGIGDYNEDEDPDIAIGAPGALDAAGSIYVVYGPFSGAIDLADELHSFYGESADAALGSAIAGTDLDADGTPDLVMGAPHGLLVPAGDETGEITETGAIYTWREIFNTPTSAADADSKMFGEIEGDLAGGTLCNLGDSNGDGYEDLAVGAPDQNPGLPQAGGVYLLEGPLAEHTYGSLKSLAEAKIEGVSEGAHLGTALSLADVDGDGTGDLLVGAPGDSTAATSAGAVYTVLLPLSGNVEITSASHQLLGEAEGDAIGSSVSGVGDLDGDGLSELIIGAPSVGGGAGEAWLVRLAGY